MVTSSSLCCGALRTCRVNACVTAGDLRWDSTSRRRSLLEELVDSDVGCSGKVLHNKVSLMLRPYIPISTGPDWCWWYSNWCWLMLYQPDSDWCWCYINWSWLILMLYQLILTGADAISTDPDWYWCYISTWSWLMLMHQLILTDMLCYSVISYLLWWTAWISVHTNTILPIIKLRNLHGLNTIVDNHHMQAIQDAECGTWDVQSIAT